MIYFYYTHTLSNCRQCGLVVKNGLQTQASGWPLTSYFLCVFLQLKREMIIAPTPPQPPTPAKLPYSLRLLSLARQGSRYFG